ncbi:MAG: TonB-dependent receptor [Chitinophagaceae bacterium]|nr:TonB-dependent receptor [Chitinophagaceae bacterium]
MLRVSMMALLTTLWLVISTVDSLAQGTPVTGRVLDEQKAPVAGATVNIRGTSTGTSTGADGNFTINVSDTSVLVVSSVGFEQQEVPVQGQTQFEVILVRSTQSLEQVVVVGYGTQRKRDVTGSVASVRGEELARQPVQTPTQALQGRVAGVQVIGSGQPNAQPQVRIRGTGSALAGVNPLYVVDGVLTDDIRNINNADIVSVDVLKDASASIYGVRAANGVIIITTRKGKAGKTIVRYDGNAGLRQATRLVEMANSQQYRSYIQDIAPTFNSDRPPLTYEGSTDWYDALLRNAFFTSHNVSLSGGSERSTFFLSGGYIEDNGIIRNNDFKRITVRANNDITVSKAIKLGTQLSYSNGNEQAVDLGGGFQPAYRAAPVVPSKVGDKYGNVSAFGNANNPVLYNDKRDQNILSNRFQATAYIDIAPVDWITFHSALNIDALFSNDRTYSYRFLNDTTTYLTAGGNQQRNTSELNLTDTRNHRWVWDNTITFDKSFGDHDLTFLVGSVTERYRQNATTGRRVDVPEDPNLWYLSQGDPSTGSVPGSTGDIQKRQSFLGRINYSFNRKYLVNASFRADGSSRFSEKWGYFPTVGAGWVLTEERFMKDQGVFDNLKLRANWGIVGNDNIASNLYIPTASINLLYFFNGSIVRGATIQDIKQTDLKWESSEQFDIGLEFSILDKKLTGELDFYNKETRDALANQVIPGIFGDPNNQFVTNIASFRNRGVELVLNWRNTTAGGLNYNVGGNVSYNQNKVTGLNGGQAVLSGNVGQQTYTTRTDNNQPVGAFHLFDAIGVFQSAEDVNAYRSKNGVLLQPGAQPGDLKYANMNDDDAINEDDRTYFGSYQPKVTYGFNFGFNYSGFDLTADFYGNAGNKIYNGKKAVRQELSDNIEADYSENRWTLTNPSNTDPRVINNSTPASTYFLESGDFLRLNNLTLGYTFLTARQKKLFSNLRIYITSQNLFTLTSYSGFTPELLSSDPLNSGIELNSYPTTRTFAFGVNLSF